MKHTATAILIAAALAAAPAAHAEGFFDDLPTVALATPFGVVTPGDILIGAVQLTAFAGAVVMANTAYHDVNDYFHDDSSAPAGAAGGANGQLNGLAQSTDAAIAASSVESNRGTAIALAMPALNLTYEKPRGCGIGHGAYASEIAVGGACEMMFRGSGADVTARVGMGVAKGGNKGLQASASWNW